MTFDPLSSPMFGSSERPPARHAKPPSDFQEAIYSAIRNTGNNVIIEAVAGSGKTTTIIEATQYCSEPVIFLAFAKANAEDVKNKIIVGEARTINSLGWHLWKANSPSSKMDFEKLDKLCAMYLTQDQQYKYGYIIRRIISTAKANGVGLDGRPEAGDFEHFITNGDWDVDDDQVSQVAELVAKVFVASVDSISTYDFDDQVYLPCFYRWSFPTFGTVLIDETQDLNRIQHIFVEYLVRAGARLIAVGDRYQSIYAFRGALSNSMDEMKKQFSMLELPLSVCYRCPTSVIEIAQKLVPHIQARAGAPRGEVIHYADWKNSGKPDADLYPPNDPELFPPGTMVICRNNAPLFKAVMRHVRARTPCQVRSNALDGLAAFVRKFKTTDKPLFIERVTAWLEKETLAAEAKGMQWKMAAVADKAGTALALASVLPDIGAVLDCIRNLKESRSGPIFSTVHKAKGLEADHVYFLRPDLVPGWWITQEEALQQEYNIRYVAVTRARETLTFGVSQERK